MNGITTYGCPKYGCKGKEKPMIKVVNKSSGLNYGKDEHGTLINTLYWDSTLYMCECCKRVYKVHTRITPVRPKG